MKSRRRSHSSFFILHSKFFILLFFAAINAYANDLTVDRRSITTSDTVTITISLENAFANVDDLKVPVKNLAVDGSPSVSSEFSWINGAVTRRRVFRFTAHPLGPGPALVGPLVLNGEGGQRDTLGPVALQALPDVASQNNDPLTILHALESSNREPFFITTEVDKESCYTAEEVIVTWYLYNAAAVQRWQMSDMPKLADFWTEEIDVRNEPPQTVIVGVQPMQKLAIRRVALFPLRSGTLTIGPLEANAEILRRIDGDSPFGLFEGSLVQVPARSSARTIEVKPLPADAAADLVGDVDLECSVPQQRGGGPVSMTVTLSGHANLRTAAAPRFDGAIDGDVQVQPLSVDLVKTADGATMRRTWRVLIFPAHGGTFRIPRVAAHVFTPSTSQRVHVQCAEASLNVTAAPRAASPAAASSRRSFNPRALLPWIGGAVLLFFAILLIVPRVQRTLRIRGKVRAITRGAAPAEIRMRVDALLVQRGLDPAKLATEPTDRGDAFRALRSLLDALERDRVMAHEAEEDVALRVRDLLQAV